MMNRVIKRMQRGVVQQQHSQRPTLTRGNKSYSDSTMETVTSDQNSIPSNSTRDTLQNNNSNHNNSSHHNGSEEISEDDMTINSNHLTNASSNSRNDDSSTHNRLKKAPSVHIVKTNETIAKRKTAVCFASDYGSPPEIIESNMILSEDDLLDCFYTTTELNSFDRDRALTVLMYQTRNKSVPWDDNEHSLRGLEEHASASSSTTTTNHDGLLDMIPNKASSSLSSSSSSSSRRTTRKDLIQSVLNEQTRLRDTEGQKEVMQASKVSGMTPEELIRELLRGVSFSLSKYDRQRAIQIAQKDEREVNAYNPRWKDQLMSTNQYYNNITSIMTQFTPNSRRRYLTMVKSRINDWSNTSNKSISSTGTCGDRSTTSSTTGNHGNESHPTTPSQPNLVSSSLQKSRNGGRRRTRKKLVRNYSNDDSVTSDHNGHCGDESDDNIDDDDFYTVLQSRPQEAIIYNDASPLSIIQQVVYETSREFDYDHTATSNR